MPELQTIFTYRAWCTNDGEGQALALRGGAAFFFTASRDPVTATLNYL